MGESCPVLCSILVQFLCSETFYIISSHHLSKPPPMLPTILSHPNIYNSYPNQWLNHIENTGTVSNILHKLTLILRRSRTGTVWFYTSTNNKRTARPKLYTKSLTRDLKRMYSRFKLVRISIKLQAPCVLYIGTGVSLLSRERFLYI